MERRGFLNGLFGGIAAGGLIVQATPGEVQAFAAPLRHGAPIGLDAIPTAVRPIDTGQELFNSQGELVAYIQSIDARIPRINVTSVGSRYEDFIAGPPEVLITAVGCGRIEVQVGQGRKSIALRGVR